MEDQAARNNAQDRWLDRRSVAPNPARQSDRPILTHLLLPAVALVTALLVLLVAHSRLLALGRHRRRRSSLGCGAPAGCLGLGSCGGALRALAGAFAARRGPGCRWRLAAAGAIGGRRRRCCRLVLALARRLVLTLVDTRSPSAPCTVDGNSTTVRACNTLPAGWHSYDGPSLGGAAASLGTRALTCRWPFGREELADVLQWEYGLRRG